jgi:hypothetical protein
MAEVQSKRRNVQGELATLKQSLRELKKETEIVNKEAHAGK